MDEAIKDYLSLWKEKHKKEIKEAKRLSVAEKFNILIHLYSMGLILMESGNKDKKLELYQNRVKYNKDELKRFIRRQLSKSSIQTLDYRHQTSELFGMPNYTNAFSRLKA